LQRAWTQRPSALFSPFRVYNNEIRIIGSMSLVHSFERALSLVGTGAIDCEALLTHRFELDDYSTAIDIFRSWYGSESPGRTKIGTCGPSATRRRGRTLSPFKDAR
jgi:hypothetical protein